MTLLLRSYFHKYSYFYASTSRVLRDSCATITRVCSLLRDSTASAAVPLVGEYCACVLHEQWPHALWWCFADAMQPRGEEAAFVSNPHGSKSTELVRNSLSHMDKSSTSVWGGATERVGNGVTTSKSVRLVNLLRSRNATISAMLP